MGRSSQELKAVKAHSRKKDDVYPVKDRDYHVVYAKPGERKNLPPGWLYRAERRTYYTKARVLELLNKPKGDPGPYRDIFMYGNWYIYPGVKPDPKWGPVCP